MSTVRKRIDEFRKRCKALMRRKGLNLKGVAHDSGLDYTHVWRLLKDRNRYITPRQETLDKLYTGLQVTDAERVSLDQIFNPPESSTTFDQPTRRTGVGDPEGQNGQNTTYGKALLVEGLVLINVRPGKSWAVVNRLLSADFRDDLIRKLHDSGVNGDSVEVEVSAEAVFGPFDVVARLRIVRPKGVNGLRTLWTAVDALHTNEKLEVVRTETYLVRSDRHWWEADGSSPLAGQNGATILLRKNAGVNAFELLDALGSLAKRITRYAGLVHACVLSGAADVAVTVRYQQPEDLVRLVMVEIQQLRKRGGKRRLVENCLTMQAVDIPAHRGVASTPVAY